MVKTNGGKRWQIQRNESDPMAVVEGVEESIRAERMMGGKLKGINGSRLGINDLPLAWRSRLNDNFLIWANSSGIA